MSCTRLTLCHSRCYMCLRTKIGYVHTFTYNLPHKYKHPKQLCISVPQGCPRYITCFNAFELRISFYIKNNGSQSVLRGDQKVRDQFP